MLFDFLGCTGEVMELRSKSSMVDLTLDLETTCVSVAISSQIKGFQRQKRRPNHRKIQERKKERLLSYTKDECFSNASAFGRKQTIPWSAALGLLLISK